MKKQLFFILIFTLIFQFLILYSKKKNDPMILPRPVFLVTDSRNNYSEIYPMLPINSYWDYDINYKLTYSKTIVRLIPTGSKLTYIGYKKLGRIKYNIYKFESETLLLKEDIATEVFSNYKNSKSLAYAIENNKELIEQISTNKSINTEICLQKKEYYGDANYYLKGMLKEYNLEKDVKLSTTRELSYDNETFSCIHGLFNDSKSYFFVSQFISN